MKVRRLVPPFVTALLLSSVAHGQPFRAYLASYGDDANPCTLAAPCRFLPAALNAVAIGGEVWILDSGGFNESTVYITKSVSILAMQGQVGTIRASGGTAAIAIRTDRLSIGLKNLVIASDGANPGTDGVVMSIASRLTVDRCTFMDLPGRSIVAAPLPAGSGFLNVTDSVFRNNGGTAIVVMDGMTANVSRSDFVGNGENILAWGSWSGIQTMLNVTDTNISGGAFGVRAQSGAPGSYVRAYVTRSTIHGTSQGLSSIRLAYGAGSTLLTVSDSTIAGNAAGYFQWPTAFPPSADVSVVKSAGNNYIDDNGSDTGTLTPGSVR